MAQRWDISLSASKLALLANQDGCERCFFDHCHKIIERPRGPFPSLPGGLDRVLKAQLDRTRPLLPLELARHIDGRLFGDVEFINEQRNWRSAMKSIIETPYGSASLIGAFDDLVEEPDKTVSPLDLKSKGSEPKDDGSQYYQVQVDVYGLQLRENSITPSGRAYLVYYWPESCIGPEITFGVKVYQLASDADRARALIERACSFSRGLSRS